MSWFYFLFAPPKDDAIKQRVTRWRQTFGPSFKGDDAALMSALQYNETTHSHEEQKQLPWQREKPGSSSNQIKSSSVSFSHDTQIVGVSVFGNRGNCVEFKNVIKLPALSTRAKTKIAQFEK